MAWTAPRTWIFAETVTVAHMNTHVRDNLLALWPYTANGDMKYRSGAAALTALAIGTAGQVLTTNAGATAPEWAGGMKLIEETLLGAPAANFDFTAIPAIYAHLKLVITGRGSNAAANIGVYMTFNADGGANYDWERLNVNAAVPVATEFFGQTSCSIGNFAAATAAAGLAGSSEVMFPDYAGTTFNKTYIANGLYKVGTAGTNVHIFNNYGHWRSSVAINQITITPNAGNFITGSIASLYGIG